MNRPNQGERGTARAARGLLALTLAAAVSLVAGCSWMPTWLGGTPSKASLATPLTEFKPALTASVAWRASIGSARGAYLQPAVLENAIFAAAADGTIVRLSPTGEVVWRADAKSKISGGVGSDGFTVAVGTPRGEVIAFGADGKPLWRAQILGEVQSPPLVGRGLVIVRGSDFRVTAFDAETGRRRWTYQRATTPLTLRGASELAFAGDLVVAGFPGGRLVAIASSNGARALGRRRVRASRRHRSRAPGRRDGPAAGGGGRRLCRFVPGPPGVLRGRPTARCAGRATSRR